MGSRLVLGVGGIGRTVLEALPNDDRPVRVVTARPDAIELLIDTDAVVPGDPTDPATLRSVEGPVDAILVGEDEPERAIAIAALARTVYEGVPIVAVDSGLDDDARERLRALVDELLDVEDAMSAALTERVATDRAAWAFHLRRVLLDVEGPLCVLAHDNPDPDAIASGLALEGLAEGLGVSADTCYFGDISHQQNRAMVNLLDLPLRRLDRQDDVDRYGAFALVDHAMPGVNDQLPEETPVAIVIDHHPARVAADAPHLDLRSDVGSTSTLMVEYYRHLDRDLDATLATALLMGIRTDTHDFTYGVTGLDFEAAGRLFPRVDQGVLDRVESPTVSAETLDLIAESIRQLRVRGRIGSSCVGRLRDRDALAQAADRLLGLEGLDAVIVYGIADDVVFISARSRSAELDIGETLREAFDQIGSAGGHPRMGGGQLPLGIIGLGEASDDERLRSIVREVIDGRFYEAIRDRRDEGGWRRPARTTTEDRAP